MEPSAHPPPPPQPWAPRRGSPLFSFSAVRLPSSPIAFLGAATLLPGHAASGRRPQRGLTSRARPPPTAIPAGRRPPLIAALGSDDRPAPPRFRVSADEADSAKSRFGPAPPVPSTPNERAAAAVAETMERLGVAAAAAPVTPVTRGPGRRVDLRTVNGGGAVAGAVGAAAIFWALWTATTWLASWYGAHPVSDDGVGGYAVARISVVVRTAVVGLVALASGMSGVTGVGLALLAGRVGYGRVTGVWPDMEGGEGGQAAPPSEKRGKEAQ